ncbi:ankyrin repeat and EF-hand domain-containing protein 1-like isoform X2 [Tubulanus polymorphus]|uniref:ankyrin repeat and EF-hand domain-containing protein 1-like isoform X2 n=1 Tax=Tubulanus polymorphus TaxID=672921 RepID=UPI003DA6C1E5
MPIAQSRLENLQICKLLQCVREEDRQQIEKLTLNGVPQLMNYNDPSEGTTALICAAVSNNESMIEFLVELGAHPDVVDFKGRSACMHAAEYGHVQCLEQLAKANADMTIEDLEGKGIIFYCISPTARHAKCLEIALENGADVNNRGKNGKPVFFTACETAVENEDVCVQLLIRGADPNCKHEATGRTALMMAAASGSVKVVRAILERSGDADAVDKKGLHSAHYAAKGGFFEVIVCLSAFGANFDVTDDKGNTPVHLAANGHAMCLKFLGQRGCNPKPKNDDGFTARVIAKDNGHKDVLKELRKVEKSFGKVGKNNEPWALKLYDWSVEREKALRELFAKFDPEGSNLIPKDEFEDALKNMNAPLEGDEEFKKICNVHDKNKDGNIEYNDFLSGKKYINKLYLMSAFEGKKGKKKKGGKGKKKKGKTKIPMPICMQDEGPRTEGGGPPEIYVEKHLPFTDTGRFDNDAPPHHPLKDDSSWYLHQPEKSYININDAAKNSDLESLKIAFQRGTPVDTRDKYYKTPLMAACSNSNIEVVRYLLNQGAVVNTRDNFKWTPLHHACHAGLKDVVELLLDHGAELDASCLNGGTPLTRAIESSRIDLVQMLIQRGAKVQIENRKGHTPLDIAYAYADPRVIDVVQAKWDTLPPPNDKKKGGKKGGKKGAARPQTRQSEKGDAGLLAPISKRSDSQDDLGRPRKGSILRAASALAGGLEDKEDITYYPRRAWTQQPTTEELIQKKQIRRERFTFEVDFPDFQMPFNNNVLKKVEIMGGAEEE